MNENRLSDYLGHIEQAVTDAYSFVEGLVKENFLADKRTQIGLTRVLRDHEIEVLEVNRPDRTAHRSRESPTPPMRKMRHVRSSPGRQPPFPRRSPAQPRCCARSPLPGAAP